MSASVSSERHDARLYSSISEKRPMVSKHVTEPAKRQKVTASAVKKNPGIKKEMRSELERSVIKKLESLGVKPDQRGLTNQELTSLLAKVHSNQEDAAEAMPDYWRCREEIASFVEQKLGGQKRGNEAASESQARSKQPVQDFCLVLVLQVRPRSSSLPSRTSQAISAAAVKQSKTPQPAPRTKALIQPKTSTPNMKSAVRISASNSDEDSEDKESDTEEEPVQDQRVKSSNLRSHQAMAVEMKAGKPTPVLVRQTAVSQPTSFKPQQSWASVGGMSRHTVSKLESDEDEDESDVSEMVEIDPRQLHGFKDQNGNIDKGNHNKDLEESSDWMVSSLEDKQEASKPTSLRGSGPLRKSLDSSSTSVWGTSTAKGPKSGQWDVWMFLGHFFPFHFSSTRVLLLCLAGLTETGTGSTLKSSLYSLSDISDSDDISNK
ncbi:hypothetical protein GOODEAATRI_023775 [Goodea atripinnis]|uniref:Cilium assembly protein DZIP1 domain-containing protein n=1 Tax=Goodea atripinnis TaxID=208336 RepID=A0ABV0N3V3_9TELE